MAVQTLSAGQRQLLSALAQDNARVWRIPRGYQLVRPLFEWQPLAEGTVQALVAAGFLREIESYGRDRSLYEITESGRGCLRAEK